MGMTNFPGGVQSAVGFYGPMFGAVTGAVTATTLAVSGNSTIGDTNTDTVTITALMTLPLASVPSYADQAAASAALAAGRLFRFDTTGALGVALA